MTRTLTVLTLTAALAPTAWGAAANINFTVPQNFVSASRKSDGNVTPVAWNINGNRCLYPASTGFANLGLVAGSTTFIPDVSTAPVLTVYADGVARARVTLNKAGDDGTFSLYTGSLTTKCVGGPFNGQACNARSACCDTSGNCGTCVMCDQNNNCSASGTVQAPCVTATCVGGTNAGAPCSSGADCNSNNCQPVTLPSGVTTCYLEQACTKDGANGTNACFTSGASQYGSGNGPFHSALGVVRSGSTFLGSNEKLVQYVFGGSSNPFTTCSTNCDGGIDAQQGTIPAVVCEH